MSYAGANKPVAPVTNPYAMFEKMYGRGKNDDLVRSVLDEIAGELKQYSRSLGSDEKQMLDEHVTYVRTMEKDRIITATLGSTYIYVRNRMDY